MMKCDFDMTERLEKYIEENKTCSALIFRDWNAFLELLFADGGSVKEILWFEYVLIENQQKSLGGGGYRDAANPAYMWAETMICDQCLERKSLTEIKDHIQRTIDAYQPRDLVPCFFDICK